MRLDRFLWLVRLSATRGYAHVLAERGHMRIDGRPVDKPAAPVRTGNVLTFVTHRGEVRVIRIEELPLRRGPVPEARRCYTELTPLAPQPNDSLSTGSF